MAVSVCLLISAFCPLPLLAVDTLKVTSPDPMLEDWRWTVFDERDGLAGTVYDVYEDGEDVWFATSEGAQHYDGFRWTTYTTEDGLVNNEVRAVIRDREGSLWFGTIGGISQLTISEAGEQDWTTYTFEKYGSTGFGGGLYQSRDGSLWAGFASEQGQTDNVGVIRRFIDGQWSVVDPTVDGWRPFPVGIGMMQASDGTMWFWGLNGILSFDGSTWALEPQDGITVKVIEAANGHIWAVDYVGDVLRFVPASSGDEQSVGTWTRYSKAEVGILHPSGCWQDVDGTIWVSGSNRVARFRDGTWFTYPLFKPERLLDNFTQGRRFNDGSFWLWSGKGAARFQNDRNVSIFSSGTDSLRVGPEGSDGSMWFYSWTSAIRLVNGVWKRYTQSDGFLNGRVRSLVRTQDGSVWAVGLHDGVGAAARFLNDRWKVFTEADGVIDTPTDAVPAINGGLWIVGTHNGSRAVSHFDGQSWAFYDSHDRPDSGFHFVRAYEASDGSLWMGGYARNARSIHRLDTSAAEGHRWMPITDDLLIGEEITGFGEWPIGTLWVGSARSVHRVDLSDLPENQTWWRQTDLTGSQFSSFPPTDKGLWFRPFHRSNEGAFHYDGESWRIVTQADGLPDNTVRHVFGAADGTVWFVGATGLSRLDEDVESGWTRFTSEDGIRPIAGLRNLTEARDGSFWMEFDGQRVMRFQYHEPPVPETYMEPAFDKVSSAGNILVRWSGTTKWNRTSPDDLRFRWRLNSTDEWTETTETDITFTALAPGSYRFEVQALSPAMRTDPTPAVHAFIVEAPWWQDPRFAIPVLALIGGVLMQSVRVVRRDRSLVSANAALSDANNDLFKANMEISEQSDRKSAFLASMSHELRTPMNAIKGFTSLVARREPSLTDRGKENLAKVSQASDHLLAQIDDLLDLSKIEAGKMEVDVKMFDVREMIEYCVSTVSPLIGEGVVLSANIDASVGEASTDEQRVRQMVINLLSNAVKFTDDGQVALSAVCASFDTPPTSSGATQDERSISADKQLVISVSDTGKGIPEGEIGTLFDEYRQVAGQSESEVQRGTGLGLSITKKFAELLGGDVSVTSVIGEGSTFTIKIPAAYAPN